MNDLYPLLLEPQFKTRPWGARDLQPIYSHPVEDQPIGEVWLTGEECRVTNGPLAGSSLAELSRRFGTELIGTAAPQHERFPLLIKFLFPREKLSVQVHPDDDCARGSGLPCGKTECWYVLAADPGAYVSLGVKPGTTRAEMERAIAEVRAEELLNRVDLSPGDLIYVDAGTVHAIGPGSILVETQQNSDTTYRLYDYGRGRELHVEQGLAAMKPETRAGKAKRDVQSNGLATLVNSPCFRVDKYTLTAARELGDGSGRSVRVVVALEGCAVISAPGAPPVTVARGEAAVVPASLAAFSIKPQWQAEVLVASLPEAGSAEPETN
jgi:mannose-6-phosphate isomerase